MLLPTVRRTLRERRLLRRGDHVLVACSGGPDSVAMLDALVRLQEELGITLVAASVDHGLRPEARAEVARVGELAGRLGVPFRPLELTVERSGSLQAAARRARYAALRQQARAESAARIAVGHTRDDQAETVLHRILRGDGLDGLSGIAPRRRDGVIRPLLDCRRADVLDHLARHKLPSSEDPSNRDPRFSRARIRADVLPALLREDPKIVDHLAALADDARTARRMIRSRGRKLLSAALRADGSLDTRRLSAAPEAARRAALALWVEQLGGPRPGRAHRTALDAALRGHGEVLLGEGLVAVAEPGTLRLVRAPPTPASSRKSERCGTLGDRPDD